MIMMTTEKAFPKTVSYNGSKNKSNLAVSTQKINS